MKILIFSMPLIASMAIFSVRAQQSMTYSAQATLSPALPEYTRIFKAARKEAAENMKK